MKDHISHYLPALRKNLLERGLRPEMSLSSMRVLDRKLWGIHKGKVYIIGGRTSNCKSAFALQAAFDLSSQGHPVLLLTLEMDTLSVMERLYSMTQKIDNFDLIKGKFRETKELYKEFEKKCDQANLIIEEKIGSTWKQIDEYIESLTEKPSVIIIDHIHEIKKEGIERMIIDEYIRKLKEMAIKHNFAAVICAQINRSSQEEKDKRPQLHHLKGTGYLEEACDVALLCHYPFKQGLSDNANYFEMHIAKNRGGITGFLKMHFDPQFYRFRDTDDEIRERTAYEEITHGQKDS